MIQVIGSLLPNGKSELSSNSWLQFSPVLTVVDIWEWINRWPLSLPLLSSLSLFLTLCFSLSIFAKWKLWQSLILGPSLLLSAFPPSPWYFSFLNESVVAAMAMIQEQKRREEKDKANLKITCIISNRVILAIPKWDMLLFGLTWKPWFLMKWRTGVRGQWILFPNRVRSSLHVFRYKLMEQVHFT